MSVDRPASVGDEAILGSFRIQYQRNRTTAKTNGVTSVALLCVVFFQLSSCDTGTAPADQYRVISEEELFDKVYASWLGQLIGNFYGLRHENIYVDEPRPDSLSAFEYAGWPLERLIDVNGAFSDDDTDIEYMYLMQMEEHGTEPTYAQLQDAWTYHVRDRVWLANRAALTSMKYGFSPPATGSKEFNPHWFQIDPQLVNEIWAVTAPGMIDYASQKSAWAARITNDSWGIEPTIHYAAMYAAAFFESDINELIDIGIEALPEGSRFEKTIEEVREIRARYPDPEQWRSARKELAERYYVAEPTETKTMWNANLNGACSILALLYGDGDFEATLDMTTAFGFDADNQAASMGGLLGIIHGMKALPEEMLILDDLDWELPFNDVYKNVSRYDMPDVSIRDLARRTVDQAKRIIGENGGEEFVEEGVTFLRVNASASFEAPLEFAAVPNLIGEVGEAFHYKVYSSIAPTMLTWETQDLKLPDGLSFSNGGISGTPSTAGVFDLEIEASLNNQRETALISLTVMGRNLARAATELLASVQQADVIRRDAMWITVGRNLLSDDVSIMNDGQWHGDRSVFYSVSSSTEPHGDFYGYRWDESQEVGSLAFRTGPMEENGSWFTSLDVEYIDENGRWASVSNLEISPDFDTTNTELNKAHYTNYVLTFSPILTRGVRITGNAGGGQHWKENSRDIYYTSITELAVYPPLTE